MRKFNSAPKIPRWQKFLFGKRVRWAFRPKMGLFVLLISLPVLGFLRWLSSDGDNPTADIGWVLLVSLGFAALAAITDYFKFGTVFRHTLKAIVTPARGPG
ncbi:hypothetical protein GRI69_08915 [Erythrobacter vulgaris]|uniref:Uncharacterized protein n=1 Tax=Qipengyuania vulgaris TaxID=291985 RepID=A0A844XS09_9SPHN|nr:hypothetical protein [Qipengyuania vulgaris]MXO48376.1 hypothetical protein [Qipengyuania vulgaris]